MSPGTYPRSSASQYEHTLSRHLANHIVAGILCDPSIVRACCEQTRHDLQMPASAVDDCCAGDGESSFVAKVAALLQSHQRFLASMPAAVASTFITELLLEKPW